MQQVIKATTKVLQANLNIARENSFQIYEFDFKVDEMLKVWLMNIDPRPRLDEQSLLTENMLSDLVKVIIDREDNKSADTGGWE